MKEAKNKGLIIGALEDDNEFQDKVLSAFHAAIAIHLVSNCVKIHRKSKRTGSVPQCGSSNTSKEISFLRLTAGMRFTHVHPNPSLRLGIRICPERRLKDKINNASFISGLLL